MQDNYTKQQQVNSGHTEITVLLAYTKFGLFIILSSPVDLSTVEDGNDVAFIEVLDCSPPT